MNGYVDYIKGKIANKKVCMFPMGRVAKVMYDKLEKHNIEVNFFSDNNPELLGTEYKGKICVSKEELLKYKLDELIIIVESLYYKEIVRDLRNIGLTNTLRIFQRGGGELFEVCKSKDGSLSEFDRKVMEVKSFLTDEKSCQVMDCISSSWKKIVYNDDYFDGICDENQYFDSDIVRIGNDEVFVDIGAYIGDTAKKFREFCNGKYKKMHLFELDPNIYKKLYTNTKEWEKEGTDMILCYPYGLSDKEEEVHFISGDSISSIVENGTNLASGNVKTLDSILENETVTFIKMDIEGNELNALKGAENIIRHQKPKLAICVYHRMEDLYEIPLYIKNLVPEYKIYLRHYTDMMLETVCYAVPESKNQ